MRDAIRTGTVMIASAEAAQKRKRMSFFLWWSPLREETITTCHGTNKALHNSLTATIQLGATSKREARTAQCRSIFARDRHALGVDGIDVTLCIRGSGSIPGSSTTELHRNLLYISEQT